MSKKEKESEPGDESPVMNRAKEIFASEKCKVLFFTSDGQAFVQPQFANMHAVTLTDTKILTIKKEETE